MHLLLYYLAPQSYSLIKSLIAVVCAVKKREIVGLTLLSLYIGDKEPDQEQDLLSDL